MRGKLGDLPTMKVEPAALERYARRADAEARGVLQASDTTGASGASEALALDVPVSFQDEVPTAGARLHSTLRPVARTLEGKSPEAVVPVLSVARDDLAWFELEPDAGRVLEQVDGVRSVPEIVQAVPLPAERTLELLRALEEQRVIGRG